MKVVINSCFGGFGLSVEGLLRYSELGGVIPAGSGHILESELRRDDPLLVQVVEELGAAANGRYAELEVVEIPDDIDWYINDYDGNEWIGEGRRWGI